jgi:hypothetical protein
LRIAVSREHRLAATLAILCACLPAHACAQLTSSNLGGTSNASSSATTNVVRTLQGEIVNANDGSPIARVLVTVNGRSVLTDSRGHFEFPGFADPQASVTLTKPGYTQTDDPVPISGSKRLSNLDVPAVLKLYPDAVITGTVTGSDGLPLAGVPVTLRRVSPGSAGPVLAGVGAVATNLHGEYRFREPAGRFQLSVGFMAHSRDTGDIVLPVSFPENTDSAAIASFEALSGQEKHIDLRPRTGPGFTIPIRVDALDAQRGVQLSAATSTGEGFMLSPFGQSLKGLQVSLPAGTYTLHAHMENRDVWLDGLAKLTVSGNRTDPVTLHLEPATSLPVELALDPDSTSAATATSSSPVTQPPDVRQFNLHLHNMVNSTLFPQDIPVRQTESKSYEFRVPPGRYRLEANSNGGWYVESASYGNADLMSSDIAISSGASGFPIRLIVNNAFGMVNVTVRPSAPTSSTNDFAWVYLIPRGPSLSALNPVAVANNGATVGPISMRLPVGSYLAAAFNHHLQGDPRDPDFLSRLSTSARPFEITAAGTATVDLEVSKDQEPAQ